VDGANAGDFTLAFLIVSAAIGLTFASGLYTGINQGFGHYRQQNTIVIVQALISSLLSIVTVLAGGGIVALACLTLVLALATLAAKAVYAVRAFGIVPSPRRFDRRTARLILGVSGWMFLINLASRVIWDTDAVIVGAVLGTVAVSHYAVALGPATAIRRLTDQFNSVSLTAASSLRAQGERDALRRLLTEGTRVVTMVICPFLVVFALFGGQFLALWVGNDFRSSDVILVVLVAGMLATAVQATATQVLFALERQPVMARVAIGEACANVALSVVLAHRIGAVGVAIGTAIPTALTAFGFYLPYAARLLGLRYGAVLGRLVLPVVVCAAGLAVLWPVADAVTFGSLPVFLVACGTFVGLCVAASILLDRRERGTYLRLVGPAARRLRGLRSTSVHEPVG
jgi:O-antigen/teichoic acid export membrane protein